MHPNIVVDGEREPGELPVFQGVTEVVDLVGRLIRRPLWDRPLDGDIGRRRERRARQGLPVVCLIRPDEINTLLPGFVRRLDKASPGRIPHCYIQLTADARDGEAPSTQLRQPVGMSHNEVLQVRSILARAANRLGSSRNARGGRIRFRRFGVLDWLMGQDLSDVDGEGRERRLRSLLRQRDDKQWFTDTIDSVNTAFESSGRWRALLSVATLLSPLYFRAKVSGRIPGFGGQYRWFLRQPHVTPTVPGTFLGFAERLTDDAEGWRQENADQVASLLTNAFLEDLRRSWRFPWRLRGPRRMTYAVLLLDDSAAGNGGAALLRLVNEVRNETGLFDPLLVISAGTKAPPDSSPRKFSAADAKSGYQAWRRALPDARRARSKHAWHLVLTAKPEARDRQKNVRDRLDGLDQYSYTPAPLWFGRTIPFLTLTAVAATAIGTGAAVHISSNHRQCTGAWGSPPSGSELSRVDGQCIGVTDGDYTFDPSLAGVTRLIRQQNQQTEQAHRRDPSRPYVTLVDVQALTPPPGEPDGLATERESLEGAAVAQAKAVNDPAAPLFRLLIGNAGLGMGYGTTLARRLPTLPATDAPLIGVIGLDRGTKATEDTVQALSLVGLPTMASSLSDDELADSNPLYYQISPQNRREAAVAAAFATKLANAGKIAKTVTVHFPDDPDNTYAENLAKDANSAFEAAKFQVKDVPYAPANAVPATIRPGVLYPRPNGANTCDDHGLVYYIGDGIPDFNDFIDGVENCGTPPALLADDDVTRYVADTMAREGNQTVPFWYTAFAAAPSTIPQGPARDFYAGSYGLYQLFPAEKNGVEDPSLDGHAALAYDAVKTMMEAVGRLHRGNEPLPLTPGDLWRMITNIRPNVPSAQSNNNILQGVTGRIDFGSASSGGHRPADKQISILRVEQGQVQSPVVYTCGDPADPSHDPSCPPDQ